MNSAVGNLNWFEFFNCCDINECTDILATNINELLNRFAPIKKKKVPEESIPWFDPMVEKALLVERDLASKTINITEMHATYLTTSVFAIMQLF